MKLSIKTMLMILIIPASINAEEISYDYIDLNIWSHKLSGQTGTASSTYDGYRVIISKAVSKNIHLVASFIDSDKKNGDAFVDKAFGFGINYPIDKKTDFVFEYSHVNYDWKYVGRTDIGGITNTIESKINHQLSDDIELTAGLLSNNVAGSKILYQGFSAGAKYNINDNFALKFRMHNLKDSGVANTANLATTEMGLSYSF